MIMINQHLTALESVKMSVDCRLTVKFYFVFQKGFSILQNNRGHITRQEGLSGVRHC